jgi:hypothetical protein
LEKLIDILNRYRLLVILDGFERELIGYTRYSTQPEDSDDIIKKISALVKTAMHLNFLDEF